VRTRSWTEEEDEEEEEEGSLRSSTQNDQHPENV